MNEGAPDPVLHFHVDLWRSPGPLPTRVHQRSIAIRDWEGQHPEWGEWWRAQNGRASLSIFWDWGQGPRARVRTRLEAEPPRSGKWRRATLYVTDPMRRYDGLDPEAVTLSFLAGLNVVLPAVAQRLELDMPGPLPPNRRERRWLEEGNEAPPPPKEFAKPLVDGRKEVVPLPEAEFWALMDSLHGDGVQRERRLRGQLRKLSLAQLAGFHATYVEATRALYTEALWALTHEEIGWASDDVFTDLRCWLVTRGREVYDAVRAQPASLREALTGVDLEEIGDGEIFAAVAEELYVDRCGRSFATDYLTIETHEPIGPPS